MSGRGKRCAVSFPAATWLPRNSWSRVIIRRRWKTGRETIKTLTDCRLVHAVEPKPDVPAQDCVVLLDCALGQHLGALQADGVDGLLGLDAVLQPVHEVGDQ